MWRSEEDDYFWKLNEVTTTDSFPTPTVDEILDELHGGIVFTWLDMKAGL